jgi:hypothetical protein
MKKYFIIYLLIYSVLGLRAQDAGDKHELFYTHVDKAIQLAVENLSEGCDPYGFSMLIKTSLTEENGGGAYMFTFNRPRVQQMVVDKVIGKLKFDIFDMEARVEVAPGRAGTYYLHAGLAPPEAPQTGYEIFSDNFNLKIGSTSSGFQQIAVQVGAVFIASLPNEGSVSGSIFYVDANDATQPWNLEAFKGSPKAKMRYRRLGPGDDRTNSGYKEPETDWKFIRPYSSPQFLIDKRDPGHYYPSVKLHGCLQRYEELEKDKELEAIVKLTKTNPDWNDLHIVNGVSVPTANLKADDVKGKNIYTKFSTGNTVKGIVLDANNRPVLAKKKVILEPRGWSIPGAKPDDEFVFTNPANGEYIFKENVPSGVYDVYVFGQPKKDTVAVCNCRERGENANYTYIKNIGGSPDLFFTIETNLTHTDDLEELSIGDYGGSGIGQVKTTTTSKIVYHISMAELIGNNGEKNVLKGIDEYPVESANKVTSFKSQVPQITDDGWKTEVETEFDKNNLHYGSLPVLSESQIKEGEPFLPTDKFFIKPLFKSAYKKRDLDLSEIQDQGAKDMLKSLNDMANTLGPATDKMSKEMDGKYLDTIRAKTFTFGDLLSITQGKKQLALSDKMVQKIEPTVKEGFLAMPDETAQGMKEMQQFWPSGMSKDMEKMSKMGNGGIGNFAMTSNYNRPVTTTIERKFTIRKSTDSEIRETQPKETSEMFREIPREFYKEIRIIY